MDGIKQSEIMGRLEIDAIGGKVMLGNVLFYGMSITPNGLEVRICYEGDISELKFLEKFTDETQIQIYQGNIIHETTGPADVFKISMEEYRPENLKQIQYDPFHEELTRQSSRESSSPIMRPRQRMVASPYEKHKTANPKKGKFVSNLMDNDKKTS